MKEMKRLIRCNNGHFFDGEKHSVCPHCNNTKVPDVTVFMASEELKTEVFQPPVKAEPVAPVKTKEEHTVHYFQKSIGTEPVVGWLVCVDGVHQGEDFKIIEGRNFIGRSGSMDISLSADKTVSRDRHAILTYDPKSNTFIIQQSETGKLIYVNGKQVLYPVTLKA